MSPSKWNLLLCGINHNTSSIEQREPLQLSHDELAKANAALQAIEGVTESVIVSTCNRIEFYFITTGGQLPFEIIKQLYSLVKNTDISHLEDCFYIRKGRHVASHLFKVAAGIDSMVLGENQIVGQIKEAYTTACGVKSTGKLLHRLFHQAFRAGKQARTDTNLGKGTCSISNASVELLRSKIDRLARPAILFVGINEMINLAATSLSRYHYDKFLFANRTLDKAVELATKYDASGHSLDELPALLAQADVVITCTGSEEIIFTKSMIQDFAKSNPEKNLIIIDMAIPRDVENADNYSKNIEIYDLEDIKKFVSTRQQQRQQEIPKVEEIVERRLSEFVYWYNHLRDESMRNGISDSFESIRELEINNILERLDPNMKNEVDQATRRMVHRLLKIAIRSAPKSDL